MSFKVDIFNSSLILCMLGKVAARKERVNPCHALTSFYI